MKLHNIIKLVPIVPILGTAVALTIVIFCTITVSSAVELVLYKSVDWLVSAAHYIYNPTSSTKPEQVQCDDYEFKS